MRKNNVQKLDKSQLFGDISSVFWISKIYLSQEREDNIRESFSNQKAYFNYSENLDDSNYSIEGLMQRKADYVNSE